MPSRYFTPLIIMLITLSLSAQELLRNGNFSSGTDDWDARLSGTVSEVTGSWGTGLLFDITSGGSQMWDVQMTQEEIHLRPGYTYTISFSGIGNGGDKRVVLGIGQDGGDYTSYIEADGLFREDNLSEFEIEWENSSVDDSRARFFLNGGMCNTNFTIVSISVTESQTPGGNPSDEFALINQVGLHVSGPKQAVLRNSSGGSFEVRDSDGTVVWTGEASAERSYQPSEERVRTIDFSSVTQPGTYAVYKNYTKISRDFVISEDPYKELSIASLRSFYFQRVSIDLLPEYAGIYARPMGHRDESIGRFYDGATGGPISSPKGWYDAGDYGKYVVNSGITTYTLLLLYQHFPEYFKDLSLNIPESGNTTPDILDEIRWNLDWMFTMQDIDGGVFHKLTPLGFDGRVMPHESTQERFVFQKSTAAALNFAAVMAKTSRIFTPFDKTFADECLEAAKRAFAWAQANPEIYFTENPEGSNTGMYDDTYVEDEFYWAAAELYASTDSSEYHSYLLTIPTLTTPDWQGTGGLGLYTILSNDSKFDSTVISLARDRLLLLADTLLDNQQNGYIVSMEVPDFVWGSNSVAANQGIALLHAYYVTSDPKYLNAAFNQIDYLLGRNPLDLSFVTGFGRRSPQNPHHRVMDADGIAAPIPGFIVGGPQSHNNPDITEDGCETYVNLPATSYIDHWCSYAANETAINWSASFSYLSSALVALYSGHEVHGFAHTTSSTRQPFAKSRRDNGITLNMQTTGAKLSIRFSEPRNGVFDVSIYNLSGRRVHFSSHHRSAEGEMNISLNDSKLSRGAFIVKVTEGNFSYSNKIIVR
ncbi:glycoside hydrolase family 9 protein [Chitinispirillales bacterium ANBcel5]|uniref:glycoside hydrolase family 9 protein n=1 Tax=Cellulosispirillum alkaliphilum TaxID=3039283 RepID=UPI002A53869D|nr:glycoside hydrolase family 9 protein [Chitinispirillales bacterium ANBcel5]